MSVVAKRTTILSLLAMIVLLAPADLASQSPARRVGYNFQHEHFEGNSGRPSSLVLGKTTKPQPDGRLLIEGLKIISFDYSESNVLATNVVIEAPTCLFDLVKRVASSTNKLSARAPDGSFAIEGIGFEYRQVESLLQISNRVSTWFPRPNLNLKSSKHAK